MVLIVQRSASMSHVVMVIVLVFLAMQDHVFVRSIQSRNYFQVAAPTQLRKNLPSNASVIQNDDRLQNVSSAIRSRHEEQYLRNQMLSMQMERTSQHLNQPDSTTNKIQSIQSDVSDKNVQYEHLEKLLRNSGRASVANGHHERKPVYDRLKFSRENHQIQLVSGVRSQPRLKARLKRQAPNSIPQDDTGLPGVLGTPPGGTGSNYSLSNGTTVPVSSVDANAEPNLANEYLEGNMVAKNNNNTTQSVIVTNLGSSTSSRDLSLLNLEKTVMNSSNGSETMASGQRNNTNVTPAKAPPLLNTNSNNSHVFDTNTAQPGMDSLQGNVTKSSKISTSKSDNVRGAPRAGELPQSTRQTTTVSILQTTTEQPIAPSTTATEYTTAIIHDSSLVPSATRADQEPPTTRSKPNIVTDPGTIHPKVEQTTVNIKPNDTNKDTTTTTSASVDGKALSVLPPLTEATVVHPNVTNGNHGEMTVTTGEPMAEPDEIPFAEPIPDWPIAKAVWKEAWPIHLYLMGTAFALLAAFSLISIIRLWRIKHLFSQKYFLSLNLLMFIMGVIRAVYLLIDGYNSNKTYPRALDYFLYSTGFPCMTSAFSILFFALLQATRMQLVGPRVQKIQVLLAIIVGHFFISIVTDFVVGYYYGAKLMLFLCELISVLWGLFLVIGYCYIFRRLYAAAVKRQRVMERLSTVRQSRSPTTNGTSVSSSDTRNPSRISSAANTKSSQKYTLSLAVKVTLGTALFGFVFIGLEIYSMFGVFGVFSQQVPEPWPWWSFEFGLRLVELCMCVTMSYIGTQPFRYVEGEQSSRWCFYCAACRELAHPRCGNQAGKVDKLAWHEIDLDLNLTNSAPTDNEPADLAARSILYRKHSSSKSPAKKLLKSDESIPMQVKHSRQCNGSHGDKANGLNGHINPSLESSADSRPVSMLIYEDGYIRFCNDDELINAISSDSAIAAGDDANALNTLHYSACANSRTSNKLGNDPSYAPKTLQRLTNVNTNCHKSGHGMQTGGGLSNGLHAHGIVNGGFSRGNTDPSNTKELCGQVITWEKEYRGSVPVDSLLFTDGESDAHSASSMRSQSRSNFSESIEQELQNLLCRKPSFNVEKAKSATNLHSDAEFIESPKSFIFTDKSSHIYTGVRTSPHEAVLHSYNSYIRSPIRSTPCSPVRQPLSSPTNKRKLLSRSNSDHLQLIKNSSVRTKVYKNAKYLSLSDLELQTKCDGGDDDNRGLSALPGQHPPLPADPVQLISSHKVDNSQGHKVDDEVTVSRPSYPAEQHRDENENLDQSEC